MSAIRTILVSVLMAASAAAQMPLGTAFAYQGRLHDGGAPANGAYDLRFELYDLPSGGTQQGATICADNVAVADGLFTAELDFGAQFSGQQRFLEIAVRIDAGLSCGDLAGFVALAPRQPVTAAPYALYAANAVGFALPYAGSADLSGASFSVSNGHTGGTAVLGTHDAASGTAPAVHGATSSAEANAVGVLGEVVAASSGSWSAGVRGTNDGAGGYGMGVWGSSANSAGVYGTSVNNMGVFGAGTGPLSIGVYGYTPGSTGYGGFFQGRGYFSENVGIGVLDPSTKLDVSGTVKVTGFQMPTGAVAGRVLKADASGNGTWQDEAGGGGLGLPYAGTASAAGAAFSVTNNHSAGSGVHGVHGASIGTSPGIYGGTASFEDYAIGVLGEVTPAAPGLYSAALRGLNHGSGDYGIGVWGSQAGSGWGGYFTSATGYGVYGQTTASGIAGTGVMGQSASLSGRGVYGLSTSTSGYAYGGLFESASSDGRGVYGLATAGLGNTYGVFGQSDSMDGRGVYGWATRGSGGTFGVYGRVDSDSGKGVYGFATSTSGGTYGIYGQADSPEGTGVYGRAFSPTGLCYGGRFETASEDGRGVYGFASATSGATRGVYGQAASTDGVGVYGYSVYNEGVYGRTDNDDDVYGSAGVHGTAASYSGSSTGVTGRTYSTDGYGVFGGRSSGAGVGYGVYFGNGLAGYGTKSFQMDHPLDPENKYLNHFCTEGPEPYNVYRGNVVTDAGGFATIALPDYFDSINRDPSYHLTVIDGSDDFVLVKVVREMEDNRFVIRSSKPSVKVSWRVDAVRNDLWVRAYGFIAEQEKPAQQKGKYLSPELYGKPAETGVHYRMELRGEEAQPSSPPASEDIESSGH